MLIFGEPEAPVALDVNMALTEAAYARSGAHVHRDRLARMYLNTDRFDDLIALYGAVTDLSLEESNRLAVGHLSRETAADDLAAIAVCNEARDKADDDVMRANLLATRAKAEKRTGNLAGARATLVEALALNPHDFNAAKRIAAIDFELGRPQDALATMDALLDQGVVHSRLLAAKAIAEARLGDIGAARATTGLDRYHSAAQLPVPPGWDSIDAFNRDLADQLLTHPGLRFDRYGTASQQTWRIDAPNRADRPAIVALVDMLIATLSRQAEGFAGDAHPWAATTPDKAVLRMWCVITDADGFETWHVHQFGWLSGVYYVQVPEQVVAGNSEGGCIGFGIPEDLAGDEAAAAFGRHLVRPRPGLMMTFPSHAYHRTYAHGLSGRRICCAFDLQPVRAA